MEVFHFDFEATGTRWLIDLHSSKSTKEIQTLIGRVRERINLFEDTYSRFRSTSLISKVSQKPGVYPIPGDAEAMFNLYFKLYQLTDGFFTPLMGQTLSDAGYNPEYSFVSKKSLEKVPDLHESLSYSYPNLEIKKPVQMDFGACGKGHIIDIIGELLTNSRVDNFCIDAGGDILYKTNHQTSLRVGLEDPRDNTQVIGLCDLLNRSICGSSGNRRKWDHFHHIINPKTLESPKDVLSVWVVADSTLLADALATCLFFVDPETLSGDFNFEYVQLFSDFSLKKSSNFPGEIFKV